MTFAPGAPQPASPQIGASQPAPPPGGVPAARPGRAGGSGAPGGSGGSGQPSPLAACVPAEPTRRSASALIEGLISWLPMAGASLCLQIGLAKEQPALMVTGAGLSLVWLAGLVAVGLGFARTGISPGKKAMGLRLVDARTGGAPGFAAWGRFLLAGLGSSVVVGWVLAVSQILRNSDGERRAWYDTVTHLVLLDVEAGRDPFDAAPGTAASLDPRNHAGSGGLGGYGGPAGPGGPGRAGSPVDASPVWAGPGLSSLASGQHGTQFGPQGTGGTGQAAPLPFAAPMPNAPASAAPPVPERPRAPILPPPAAPPAAPTGVTLPTPTEVTGHLVGPPPAAPPPLPVAPRPAAVPPPPLPAAPVSPTSHGATAPQVAPPPPSSPPALFPTSAEPAVPSATFTFTSGQVHRATGAGVIGRAPRPSATGEIPETDPDVLTITDVSRTVSKSHLSFKVELAGVWVADLGSTNGSTVIGTDGVTTPLEAGTAVLAAYGSTVTVGEMSFVVTADLTGHDGDDDIEYTIQRARW